VIFGAFGSGASGSSTTSAKLFVLPGSPRHASGGDTSLPSHVCLRGMLPFDWNAEDSITSDMTDSFRDPESTSEHPAFDGITVAVAHCPSKLNIMRTQ